MRWRALRPCGAAWSIVLALALALAGALGATEDWPVREQAAHADYAAGRFNEALAAYERLLTWRRSGSDGEALAGAMNDVALAQQSLARYREAEQHFSEALALEERLHGGEHTHVASRLVNLAEMYRNTGRYAEAEPLYWRAIAINRAQLGAEHLETGIASNNLAELLRATGRLAEAEVLYRQALPAFEKLDDGQSIYVGYALNNLSLLARRQGRLAEAAGQAQRAHAILARRLGERHPHAAIALNNLAFIYDAMGRHAEAEPVIRQALEISESVLGEQHPSVALNLKNLGRVLAATGRHGEAEAAFERAWRVARQADNPEVAWKVLSELMAFHRRGNEPLAIFYGKQAINVLQSLRSNLRSTDPRAQKAFVEAVEEHYRQLADLLIGAGRLPEAQQVLAMLKEEEYFEFVSRSAATDPRQTQAGLTASEQAATAGMAAVDQRLFERARELRELEQQRTRGMLDEAGQTRLREARLALREANAAFEAELAALKARFAGLKDDRARLDQERRLLEQNLSGTLAGLGEGVALLQTVTLPDGLTLLLTTERLRHAYRVPLEPGELNRAALAAREASQNPGRDPRPALGRLYDWLIRPLAADLQAAGIRTLMFSLDGVLRYVPMAALHDGQHYLAESLAVSLFNEAARSSFSAQRPQAHWRVAGLGLSQAREGFSPLTAVPDELRSIAGQDNNGALPGQIFLDDQFTLEALLDAADDGYPVMHVASHFKFQPGSHDDSFLLLGNGRLSLAEFNRRVSLPAVELLTLSACETAVGGGGRGSEVEGLAVTAQLKGAKAVLATLWPVADVSTGLFMQDFYRRREALQLTKTEALRQVQQAFINGSLSGRAGAARGARVSGQRGAANGNQDALFAHPFYWAPFVLMGNWL